MIIHYQFEIIGCLVSDGIRASRAYLACVCGLNAYAAESAERSKTNVTKSQNDRNDRPADDMSFAN